MSSGVIFVSKTNPLHWVEGAAIHFEDNNGWATSKGFFNRSDWYAQGSVPMTDFTSPPTQKIKATSVYALFEKEVSDTLRNIGAEYYRTRQSHPPLASAHEGYAIALEEVEEVWDVIKHHGSYKELVTECLQAAAMFLAIIVEAKEIR